MIASHGKNIIHMQWIFFLMNLNMQQVFHFLWKRRMILISDFKPFLSVKSLHLNIKHQVFPMKINVHGCCFLRNKAFGCDFFALIAVKWREQQKKMLSSNSPKLNKLICNILTRCLLC